MLHARRQVVLLLAVAGLAATSCQQIKLSIVNFVLVSRTTNYDGNDRLVYKADLRNDSTIDVLGAWAQVSGGVPAGATVLDDVLQFGRTPVSGTSTSTDGFIVIVPPGAAFDPTVLTWTTHAGVNDQDQDGLTDGQEHDYGWRTDSANPDTDGDGVGDGIEVVAMFTDPLSAQSAPDAFPDGVFYSSGPRPGGKTAVAVVGPYTGAPFAPILVGPGGSGPFGPAFDRNGFLYVARGADVAHLDTLTGQLLGSVSLHDSNGNPVQATELAYDPTTDSFVAVKNDPATGAPTPQLMHVDVHTGLATEFGAPLPGTPRAITIRPEIDASNGTRWLYALVEDASGTQELYKLELGSSSGSVVSSPFGLPATGLAFGQHLDLQGVGPIGDGHYGLYGGTVPSGPFDIPLQGLAIPRPCPAPCFAPAVYRGLLPDGMAVGDVDGDGDPDVVLVGSNYPSGAGLDWYANDGSGNLVAQPATTTSNSMTSVALADFDGDGHLDAALIDGSDDYYWARGHGSGAFDPPVPLGSGSSIEVRAGDVTGDGAPDIVAADIVLGNDGAGSFTPYRNVFGNASAVAIAKLDGGPVRQVVAIYGLYGSSSPDEVVTFIWKGPATGFVETSRQALDFVPIGITAGDLDGDGFDDVVVTGFESGTNTGAAATLRAAGNGSLQAPVRLAGVPSLLMYSEAVIADVTGDGRPDIVLDSCADPQKSLRALVGDGAGHFQRALFDFFVGDCSQYLATADLDGDGRTDLISSFSLSTALQVPVYPVK